MDHAWAILALALAGIPGLHAQDLTPRAYLITPVGSHAVILSSSFSRGDIVLDPSVPIENAKGSIEVPVIGYYESFDLSGHSANVTLVVPYAHALFQGTYQGEAGEITRSGLADLRVRFSVNLAGGRAMNVGEYVKWKEKRLVGVSLTMSIPTGQYDSARIVSIGTNRWGFKPEVGLTRRWNRWALDAYGGVWFFTANNQYSPGSSLRTQSVVGSVEGHWGYYFRPRLWASLDVNFWTGGRTAVNGVEKPDQQRDSRVGGTVSVPINRHQAVKLSYNQGAYITVGGAYRTLAVGWQYSWISAPQ